MNLTAADLETIALFLAHHQPMFAAFCHDMKTNPAHIAREIVRQHHRAVKKQANRTSA